MKINDPKIKIKLAIKYYEDKIGRYLTNQEYVDPNCSLQEAYKKLEKLRKELLTNYNLE